MIERQAPLAAAGEERDSDGRRIGLVFDSMPPLPAPNVNAWLMAVDGSANALRAVAHVAHVTLPAMRMDACALHLVHVAPWLSKEAAEAELAPRALAATLQARELLDANGLPWRLHVAMGDPAERILEQARRLEAACIVVGRRGLGTVESLLFGSVTGKILQLSHRPVLVVP